jgi:hypothetical protein
MGRCITKVIPSVVIPNVVAYFVIVVVVAVPQGVSFDVVDRLHEHLQHVSPAEHQFVDGLNLLQKSETDPGVSIIDKKI